jgi:hypothetical protein
MLKRRGRHQLDPLVVRNRGIVWFRMLLSKLLRRPLKKGVGFSGPHSSRALHDPLCLSRLAQGQLLSNQLIRATQIVALIVGFLATLHENAPRLRSQIRGKFLIRTIRTRAKDRLFMFSREGSISLHLLIFQKVHQ